MPIVKHIEAQAVEQDERSRPRDLAGLVAELGDANPTARRWAARDLAQHADAAKTLAAQLEHESDPAVREAIFMSLTEIGDSVAVQGLMKFLRSEDAAIRNEAIDAMKNLPDVVAPFMTGLLTDADADVRILALNILESLRHPDVEKWLLDVIRNDPHVNVCATAVDLLGEVGSEAALMPLENLKQRFPNEPYIAFASDLALKRIRED
ncbi:MAG TPA: HEAT repeat domain-containing protein [Rhodocyclaceae bacterium]|nr:HEAT repeat domain-containing protein [Rhodocyclaceae bacterium]